MGGGGGRQDGGKREHSRLRCGRGKIAQPTHPGMRLPVPPAASDNSSAVYLERLVGHLYRRASWFPPRQAPAAAAAGLRCAQLSCWGGRWLLPRTALTASGDLPSSFGSRSGDASGAAVEPRKGSTRPGPGADERPREGRKEGRMVRRQEGGARLWRAWLVSGRAGGRSPLASPRCGHGERLALLLAFAFYRSACCCGAGGLAPSFLEPNLPGWSRDAGVSVAWKEEAAAAARGRRHRCSKLRGRELTEAGECCSPSSAFRSTFEAD